VSYASLGNRPAAGSYDGDPSYGDCYVLGLRALHAGQCSDVKTVSCASPGNCVAGGLYADGPEGQAFVINESNVACDQAINMPRVQTLNRAGS
jgi:hypothetical protein